jgi:type IV pilus assembly protein PilB
MLRQTDDKLGEYLVENGVVTASQLEAAIRDHLSTGDSLLQVLVKKGYAPQDKVLRAFANMLELPYLELTDYSIEEDAARLISKETAFKHRVLPVFRIGNVLTLAMSDPGDVTVIDLVRRETGMEIEPAVSSEEEILATLEQHFGPAGNYDSSISEVIDQIEEEEQEEESESTAPDQLAKMAEDAPVIKLVNLIVAQAIRDGASDIHIEPEENLLRVRNRIDGVLHEAFSPPKKLQAAITSRIKILSNLDIAETRVPQDGRFQIKFDRREVDIRVSTLPTVYGENIVMRILDKGSLLINLEDLGLVDDLLPRFKNLLTSAYGIILVTGPTGSGKTTTLYSALQSMNTPDKNIITIEDPVEYRLPLIRQSQVNHKAGLTFATGLRSILRQDPDIVMVGEIRDSETAKTAVEAALTGHLVLSTLHTNDAPGALPRLTEMGVEPFLVASATIGVIAQRLVRRLCEKCKEAYRPKRVMLEELGFNPSEREWVFYRGKGCQHCKQTGYKGRLGIYEIMTVSEEIRELTTRGESSDKIKKAALRAGMRPLRHDGFMKALRGWTSVEEVVRVTNLD